MTQEFNESLEQGLGLGENVGVTKVAVYLVVDTAGGLITTSGRLGVTTLSATIAAVIANYDNRADDWVVTLSGVVVGTIHTNGTFTLP